MSWTSRIGGCHLRVEYNKAMRWKQNLTPLAAVSDLGAERVHTLMEHHITTAEELVGQIEAAPQSLVALLDMDEAAVRDLGRRALQASNPEIAGTIEAQRGRRYSLGARIGRPG